MKLKKASGTTFPILRRETFKEYIARKASGKPLPEGVISRDTLTSKGINAVPRSRNKAKKYLRQAQKLERAAHVNVAQTQYGGEHAPKLTRIPSKPPKEGA